MSPQTVAVLLTGWASVIHRGVTLWKCFCNRDKISMQHRLAATAAVRAGFSQGLTAATQLLHFKPGASCLTKTVAFQPFSPQGCVFVCCSCSS